MGLTFHRQIKILPWLYLNIGKGSFSFSFRPQKGASINVGSKRGPQAHVGLPGTGVGYNWNLKNLFKGWFGRSAK